jgi:hypothetical protein
MKPLERAVHCSRFIPGHHSGNPRRGAAQKSKIMIAKKNFLAQALDAYTQMRKKTAGLYSQKFLS